MALQAAGGASGYERTKDGRTFIYDENPKRGKKASWSGGHDPDGYAEGYGTLTWYKGDIAIRRITGKMVHGKFEGSVTKVGLDGKTSVVNFAAGKTSQKQPAQPHAQLTKGATPATQAIDRPAEERIYQSRPVDVNDTSLSVSAHQGSIEDRLKNAEAQLNSAYKNCLAKFPSNQRERLRIAQRAWIVFTNKDEAAAELAGRRRGVSTDELDQESVDEMLARVDQLKSFFILAERDKGWYQQELERAEQELTSAYQQALQLLSPDEQEKLRDAERNWIDFRDKDAHTHNFDRLGRSETWAATVINHRRTLELQQFYLTRLAHASQSPGFPTLTPVPQTEAREAEMTVAPSPSLTALVMATQPQTAQVPSPSPTIPPQQRIDPAVRDKMVKDFRADTKTLLTDVSTGSLNLARLSKLSETAKITVPLSSRIAPMLDKTRDLRSNLGYEDADRQCGSETTAIDAVVVLNEAASAIKSGDAQSASFSVDSFLAKYPEPPQSEEKQLWESMRSLKALCGKSSTEAAIHLHAAESLAGSGKTMEAIKEYQTANGIFPDPKTARTIKQLQDERVGL